MTTLADHPDVARIERTGYAAAQDRAGELEKQFDGDGYRRVMFEDEQYVQMLLERIAVQSKLVREALGKALADSESTATAVSTWQDLALSRGQILLKLFAAVEAASTELRRVAEHVEHARKNA